MGANMQRQAVRWLILKHLMLVLVWNIKLPMIQELQLLPDGKVVYSSMLIKLKFVVKMVLLMFILFQIPSFQVLPTTSVLWLRLAILLKKVTFIMTVHLWKVEKWPSVKNIVPAWHGKVTTSRITVIMSEASCERANVYTSVHLEEFESETRDTKRAWRNYTWYQTLVKKPSKDLDEMGIIRIGAEVKEGDILVGKVTLGWKRPFCLKNVFSTYLWW